MHSIVEDPTKCILLLRTSLEYMAAAISLIKFPVRIIM